MGSVGPRGVPSQCWTRQFSCSLVGLHRGVERGFAKDGGRFQATPTLPAYRTGYAEAASLPAAADVARNNGLKSSRIRRRKRVTESAGELVYSSGQSNSRQNPCALRRPGRYNGELDDRGGEKRRHRSPRHSFQAEPQTTANAPRMAKTRARKTSTSTNSVSARTWSTLLRARTARASSKNNRGHLRSAGL
jgi:hypothetical protein